MKYILNAIAAISLLYGLLVIAGAKSAIHEIEAGVSFVIFVISIGFAGVISRLPGSAPSDEEKVCMFCQEKIKAKALVCRFCGKDLPPSSVKVEPVADKDLTKWVESQPFTFNGKQVQLKSCPKCGGQHQLEAVVCGGCGWKPK